MTSVDSLTFLRRSLEDLDAELAAGDIDPADYSRLRDQYVARLARALRREGEGAGADAGGDTPAGDGDLTGGDIARGADAGDDDLTGGDADAGDDRARGDDDPAGGVAVRAEADGAGAGVDAGTSSRAVDRVARAPAAGRPARGRWSWRAAAWALGVLVFAVGAGVVVARASGTRTDGQAASGDVQASIRQQLDHCLQLSGQGQALEAIKCYDGVLAEQPSSAEANAYRAWTLIRVGDQRLWPAAQENLDQAVALDPSYPDARVFRAVLERNQGRLDDARADLAAFDALNPPQLMRDLVDSLGLRASLAPGGG